MTSLLTDEQKKKLVEKNVIIFIKKNSAYLFGIKMRSCNFKNIMVKIIGQ